MEYVKGISVEAHTEDWINARLGHFTSSEWAKLFKSKNLKKCTYIDEKVAEILTRRPKEIIRGIPAIDWGVAHEPDAADAYSILTNQKLIHSGFYEYSIAFGGTPDRECANNPKLIQEIKAPYVSSNFTAACEIMSGEQLKDFDLDKYIQCQGNMIVTCAEMCDLIFFDPRMRDIEHQTKIIRIYRDNDLIKDGLQLLDDATEVLTDKIERILKMHSHNLTYRIAS